ncbi:MAG: FAD/NAD(P)-binding protein [Planctomycetota bacterium]
MEWLIIGGGPHGFHLTMRLLAEGVSPDAIRVLDPHAEPLERWRSYTGHTGMSHLRSPQVHNLGIEALALASLAESDVYRLAKGERRGIEPDFIPPYERPSLALFMHHARELVEASDLSRLWKQGRAASMQRTGAGFWVELQSGERLVSRNVVLALGAGDQLRWPDWARVFKARAPYAPLDHVFGPDFRRECVDRDEDVVLVGAGISAAQLALALADTNRERRIVLLSRHSLRQADFDSDPGWLGPLFLDAFDAEPCPVRRRAIVDEARKPGSLAVDVKHDLSQALRAGRLAHTLAHIDRATWEGRGSRIELEIRTMGLDEDVYHRTGEIVPRISGTSEPLAADRVVLCTGFEPARPGGAFVARAIEALRLPLAPDGYPVVDEHLRWSPGLFVMGPLAELVVGPAARNLSGARMAAQRIVESREVGRTASGRVPASPAALARP